MRIVILEDEAAHAEAIRRALENAGMGGDISVAGTLKEYREIVSNDPPDIALLDLNLPDGRAVEVLRSPPEDGPFPVLIMTSFGNEQVAVEALKSGALDYVVKSPEAFAAMPRSVTRVLREWTLLQERKRAEENLRTVNEELEVRVRERTRELEHANAELRRESEERVQAIDALRENEQLLLQQNRLAAMGEMISNIAHQWRQPLNMLGLLIQDLAKVYEKGLLDDDYLRETKEKAMQVIKHMSQTIDDFRNFFSPGKGRVSFKANDVVSATVSLLQVGFKDQQIALDIVEEDDVMVEGHPNEFSQVILNILMNARDAFRDRSTESPRVLVRIFRENGRPAISISDNAGGIPPEILGRIFEPYFTTKGQTGTGIGLFMSKTIVEKTFSGSLSARNTEDGAEFLILL